MKQQKRSGAKLTSARRLLELLWDEQSRPSLRWLRQKTKEQAIPHLKLGGRVFFDPAEVTLAFQARTRRSLGKGDQS
jgi:hypothetical protein